MPQGKHSTIQTELAAAINTTLKNQQIARAFSELRCTFGGRSIVPDISVFQMARIPRDNSGEIANVFSIAPDWTIEILSPDQSQTKVTKNILHCLQYDTSMGWLIDPDEQTIFVYSSGPKIEVFDNQEMKISVPSFATNLEFQVKDIFAWLF